MKKINREEYEELKESIPNKLKRTKNGYYLLDMNKWVDKKGNELKQKFQSN